MWALMPDESPQEQELKTQKPSGDQLDFQQDDFVHTAEPLLEP